MLRPVYIPTVPVFVRASQRLPVDDIARGSGIVGQRHGMSLLVYFEGNLYGSQTMLTYADRVHVAASRMDDDYPTVAKGWWLPGDFVEVGYHNDAAGGLTIYPDKMDALREWLDSPGTDLDAEVLEVGVQVAARRLAPR